MSDSSADRLRAFVVEAKERGLSDDTIVSLLRTGGWPDRSTFIALSAYYERLGLAVPARRQSQTEARDAFLHLIYFIALAFWTIALGQIFYDLIARAFPDAATAYLTVRPLRDDIAWQLGAVIVAFPLFVFVHRLLRRELAARPELFESGVRRWLTYVALVFAALVVISDAVWFVAAFVRGELSVRFALDSLVLLVLGGGVFVYYLGDVERKGTP